MSKRIHIITEIFFSFCILGGILFFKKIDLEKLAASWIQIDTTSFLFIVMFSALIHVFVGAHKLWLIIKTMGGDIAYGSVLMATLGSGPLRLLMPLDLGSIFHVVFFSRHRNIPFARALGAMAFDKGSNFFGLVFWLLLSLVFITETSLKTQVLFIVALSCFCILFLFYVPLQNLFVFLASCLNPRMGRYINQILVPFREFSQFQKLYFLSYGFVFSLRPLIVCLLLFWGYDIHLNMLEVFPRASLAIIAGHMPLTFLGLGARELMICELFSKIATKEIIFSIGLMMTLTVYIIPMALGFPWLTWFLKKLANNGEDGKYQKGVLCDASKTTIECSL